MKKIFDSFLTNALIVALVVLYMLYDEQCLYPGHPLAEDLAYGVFVAFGTSFLAEVAKVILDNTIRIIKEMGVNIITEGVETSTQRDYLKSVGCDYCQGYYFSKPVERDKFVDYCKSYKSEPNQTELNRAVM